MTKSTKAWRLSTSTSKIRISLLANKSSNKLAIVSEDEKEDNEEHFDQDLVEAFLEMENCIELANYITEMDKARYKEIGYVVFQVYKQRKTYAEVKELFKTENEDTFDFDEAVKTITDIILTTGNFKKLSKYVRTQLIYGLSLIKKQKEEVKISEETTKLIESKWKMIRTDSIRLYAETVGFHLSKEMLTQLIQEFEKANKQLEVLDLVQEFEMFDLEINWKKCIDTLIGSSQWARLITTLEHKEDLISYAIGQMSNNKYAKEASVIIQKMGLDISDYPLILERLQKKTIRYYVYNFKGGSKSKDFIPLWKIEDLFRGYNSMLAYIAEEIAYKKDDKNIDLQMLKYAKAFAIRNKVYDEIRKDVQRKLDKIELTPEDMNIDCIEDTFGTISKPAEEYFSLPAETNVTFIGSEEEIKLAEVLLESTCLGVDWEWRPSMIKFNVTTVALMQIGDKRNIFLFDMKALNESEVLDEHLTKVFDNDKIDIIGMSFHNDLREIAFGCPKLKFFKKIENLYDVQPMFASIYKKSDGQGLTKIVDAIIGKKVCKAEQMGNWELRPLRKSQMHYGALDAYILVELFERMKTEWMEKDINIEDFKHSFTASGGIRRLGVPQSQVDFDIHKKDIGKAMVKTIKLKAGQGIAPNDELLKVEKDGECRFCVDFNLSRLHKLFKHMGFESVKISKKQSALERVKLWKQESLIFVTKDDLKFNKSLSILAILVRKNDSADKQFNNIMKFLEIAKEATKADIEAIKGEDMDADVED